MRINVYAEELTRETEIVKKTTEDGRQFLAVRLFLASPRELHHSIKDDDRSAITFWVPWYEGKNHPEELMDIMHELHATSVRLVTDSEKMNKAEKQRTSGLRTQAKPGEPGFKEPNKL